MTAICGVLGLEDKVLLKDMCSYMKHRGQTIDTFIDDNMSLAIIRHFNEPKLYYDDEVVIAIDQDIYAIQDKVIMDSSAIYSYLKSCILKNVELVKNLRGSFAFSVAKIDEKKKKVFLGRDIYGTRSLYYMKHGDLFLFASEMKPFAALEDLKLTINTHALNFYLTCGFSPTRETILTNVHKVLPAEIVEYIDNNLNYKTYWSPIASKQGPKNIDYWAQTIFGTLSNVIKLLIPEEEQNLGIALSGGIDSSFIAALLRKIHKKRNIISFTIDYGIRDKTELKLAATVADYLNLEYNVVYLEPDQVVKDLEMLQWIYDEPLIKFTFIPTYYLFKTAKKYVKTVFTGDGGDELFIGYRSDYWEDPLPIKVFLKMPNTIRESFLKLGQPITEALADLTGFKTLSLVAEFFVRKSASHPNWKFRIASRVFQGYFSEEELPKIIKFYNDFSDVNYKIAKLLNSSNSNNIIEKISHAMIMSKLPDDLLRLDKAVAIVAVKARSPLLDPFITNFALSIPIQLRYNKITKFLIRYVIKRYYLLPNKIVDIKSKRGLMAPLHYWLSKTAIRDYITSLIESSINFFNTNYIKKIWPPKTYTKTLKAWNLATLLLWLKVFPAKISYVNK